jgi:hypothetical protein
MAVKLSKSCFKTFFGCKIDESWDSGVRDDLRIGNPFTYIRKGFGSSVLNQLCVLQTE